MHNVGFASIVTLHYRHFFPQKVDLTVLNATDKKDREKGKKMK